MTAPLDRLTTDVRAALERLGELFGSRARGDSRPDSDVDLLVVWKDESPPRERALAVHKVLRGLKVSFDIAVVTPSEFARFAERRAHVVGLAAREGRVLHAA